MYIHCEGLHFSRNENVQNYIPETNDMDQILLWLQIIVIILSRIKSSNAAWIPPKCEWCAGIGSDKFEQSAEKNEIEGNAHH